MQCNKNVCAKFQFHYFKVCHRGKLNVMQPMMTIQSCYTSENIKKGRSHWEKKQSEDSHLTLYTQNNSLPIRVQASQDIRVTDLILKKCHSVVLLSRRDPEKLILRRTLQALFNFRMWPPEDAPTIQQWSVLGSSVISFLNRGVPEFQPFLTGKALQPLDPQWPFGDAVTRTVQYSK